MTSPLTLLVMLIAVSITLLVALVVRPALTAQRAGKIFAFVAVVILPVAAGFAGLNHHMEQSKRVEFCLSCHPMEQYGRSLHVDDVNHLPATHYQFSRIPRETACFACHTNYTLYGDYKAKLSGLRHVYVQYLGKIPSKIELRVPYNNRECLHCHEGSRSFLDGVTHKQEANLDKIRKNELSCVSKDCHGTVHDVANVDKLALWPPEEKPAEGRPAGNPEPKPEPKNEKTEAQR